MNKNFRKTAVNLVVSSILSTQLLPGIGISAQELPEPGDFKDVVNLKLSGSFTKGEVQDDNWVQKRLEEQFNVQIENTKINTWDANEVSIMIASGELPDTFSFTTGGMTPKELYYQGLTRSIPREMIEKYAPNYAKMLNETNNGIGWKMTQSPDNENEHIALIGLQSHAQSLLWAPTLRLDWMEKLGLDIPEDIQPIGDEDGFERIYFSHHSYTLDELEEILTAFVTQDPDGNGQDDTYGILPANDSMNWATTLLGSYGVAASYNLEVDGKVQDTMISEPYKQFLSRMVDWYKKGLIDPEWTTLPEKTTWEKYQTGKVGYVIAQKTYLAQEAWTKGRAPQNILDADPNAKLLALLPETGDEGQSGQQAFTPVTALQDTMQISKNVTDEQLARYLQIYDFMTFNPEGVWTTYGIPGEHSDYVGEEGKSTLVVRDEYPLEEKEMGFWAYNHRSYPGVRYYWLTAEKTLELNDMFFGKPENIEKYFIRPYKWDLFDETGLSDLEAIYNANLQTIENEFRMNVISGAVDLESEWDAYVETWLSSGGQEILDELEKAPLVSDLLAE